MKLSLSKIMLLALPVAAIALLLLALQGGGQRSSDPTATGKALIGGSFSLIDHTGRKVTDRDYLGKYQLVYFGYTYCPEICPMSLQNIADAMEHLGPRADELVTLFVTVDPDRDTPAHLADYVSNFDKRTVGLTGSKDELLKASKAYRIYSKKVVSEDAIDFDHSAITFMMDRKGQYITHFAYGVSGEAMAKKINDVFKKRGEPARPSQKISKLNKGERAK